MLYCLDIVYMTFVFGDEVWFRELAITVEWNFCN